MASEPQKTSLLVLGASSKLGRMLRAVWEEKPAQDIEITYVYRGETFDNCSVSWAPGDDLNKLPRSTHILALWGATPRSGNAFDVNVSLAHITLELAKTLGVRRVLHCSSAAVYEANTQSLTESDMGIAPNEYGRSKQRMEQLIRESAQFERDQTEHVIMRLANIAGADALFENMTPGADIQLDRFADGQGPLRSYLSVYDLATVISALAKADAVPNILNVAAPKLVAMEDLAKHTGCRIEWRPAPETAVQSVHLNTDKLARIITLDPSASDPGHLVQGAKVGGIWP